MIANVREIKEGCIVPARYILVVTDEIDRDKANDLSRIAVAVCRMNGETEFRTIVENLRIFHEYAVVSRAPTRLMSEVAPENRTGR